MVKKDVTFVTIKQPCWLVDLQFFGIYKLTVSVFLIHQCHVFIVIVVRVKQRDHKHDLILSGQTTWAELIYLTHCMFLMRPLPFLC